MLHTEHDNHYESVDIAEFSLSTDGLTLRYPCPCGDEFEISLAKLTNGDRVAQCPTCSLTIFVQYRSLEEALESVMALQQESA